MDYSTVQIILILVLVEYFDVIIHRTSGIKNEAKWIDVLLLFFKC